MIRLKNAARWLLILQMTFGSLPPQTRAAAPNEEADAPAPVAQGEGGGEPQGLRFRLSEGAEESGRQSPAATPSAARAEKISEAEAARVLQRLPPLKAREGDEQDFALREKSLPPPRAGQTVLAAFPAPAEREAPDAAAASGPFEVVRYSPSGEVPLAPQLNVTFSQPMVAVTSQEEAAREVPVRLSPEVPGRWRWLGTKTLIFDPAGERLPMATEFTVSVPAGARSASGGSPKTAATWKFSTPPPQLKTKHPEGGPVRRDAIMFVEFDQRIDPAAVLRTVNVRAGAAGNLPLRLATADEIAADPNVSRLSKAAVKDRWLAFRALGAGGATASALPQDASVSVTVGPGTPSAEGPRVTTKTQFFSFRTYGPLRVMRHQCGWQKTCTPFDQWQITFSNSLDQDAFDKKQLRFSPELPEPEVQIYGNTLYVQGTKKGRTTYRLTLPASLRDEFGQTLGEDVTLSFTVGSAPPSLFAQGGNFVVLDPSARRSSYSVYSVNHPSLKVSLYAVGPEDWERFGAYMRAASGYYDAARQQKQTPPGRLVSSQVVKVAGQPDELTETRIDLAPALRDGLGQALVVFEQTTPPPPRQQKQKGHAWVQVTNIGLDAFVDRAELVGWATSLKDGQPLAGVEMRLHGEGGAPALSGADGTARLALPPKSSATAGLLVARRGAETAILPERADWWSTENGWVRREAVDSLFWYVFDDRKMYRPGEEVSVKGWIRRVGGGKTGDVGPLAGAAESVSYAVRDSRGNEITKGSARLNALGGFDLSFKLPATLNLGGAALHLEALGGTGAADRREHVHQFQVQEFRRPEFEVTAKASEGPHFVGSHAQATVSANYFAGGGLPNSEVIWRVTATPGHFTPPNRDDYTFGKWVPWWGGGRPGARDGLTTSEVFGGRTDAAGNHRLRIDFDGVRPPRASSVTAQAVVTDVNRQAWTATTTLLVHPADLYVGLRSDRTFVRQGEPLVVQTIVTDLDGRAVAGREVKMKAALLEWTYAKGEWKQTEADEQECSVRSAADAVKCSFAPKKGGTYRVTARVFDDRERPNESELTLWVAGGKQPPKRGVEQETVELIPDRKEYRAGEAAEILVQSPFFPAEGVLTLRRSGLVRTERFRMDGPSHTLRIPIEEAFTPNVYAHVNLVGAAARAGDAGEVDEKLPKRPAFAEGELNLSVPPLARRLQVTATPRDKALEPGGETTVGVEVKDAAGRAVQGSELAVVVVDESVLALTGYQLEDPASFFYAARGADVRDHHLRANVLLEDPARITERQVQELPQNGRSTNALRLVGALGGNADAAASPAPPPQPVTRMARRPKAGGAALEAEESKAEDGEIRLRADFNALAVFVPSVLTDAGGRAEVKVKVPDSLTRYRVMAVSVAGGKQFGKGESSITARMPLMVRPSAPRFLNFGDRFELPVVLQNQTDKPLEVNVAVRASNAELTDGSGRRVTVPANDRVEVRFPTSASRAGRARFQLAAASGRHADAAEVELPVWTPATTEAFATYGELDASGASVVQPFKAPPGVFPQFGGLEVSTSSTQLQALTDAVLYLVSYPYECSEQLASRVLAVAALRDVLTAFKAKDLPPPEEMKAAVARDLKRLQGMQNPDGGFGFWRRGEESWPYVSIHVAHALARAREKGFDVPEEMLNKSKSYLRGVEQRIPAYYSPEARNALVSYALNVRLRLGDRDAARARRLMATAGLEKLSLEAVGWLLPVLSGDAASAAEVAAVRRHLDNRATETAGAAHFVTSYADADYLLLHSSRRADGVILEALIGDQPQSDLIPKIVRGLLAHRRQGRWENTQENVFILLALDRYFNTYEKTTPDFVARAWVGEAYAGEQEFRGRSTERRQLDVPMSYLAERPGTQNLILSKEGAGRLYYRVGMQYAPSSLKLAAADYGFTVARVYEALDDPSDVRRDADGTWRIKAGSKVRVRLTLGAPARRYHVALVDPLPAGLEALNPALAVTEAVPRDEKAAEAPASGRGWWWWYRPWFEHQNMRDERVEAFASLLWDGVYNYSYVARATTPGHFVVPPPKAEEMYHPETFGRGSTDRVVVE
jgi:uncharacterized protein YfaS (alpha-2-macroglobulin family)